MPFEEAFALIKYSFRLDLFCIATNDRLMHKEKRRSLPKILLNINLHVSQSEAEAFARVDLPASRCKQKSAGHSRAK